MDPDSHSEDALSLTDNLDIASGEEYDDVAAKQRASVLWLLSKAYMPKIPSELFDPCYVDHKGNERLKPQIVHALANAELYCLALGNIYADPNYHNLNHHGILQVLMRKGIDLIEPLDAALTETVLVQTAPIRMSAHMAVIEGIMALFVKEVLIPEKVMEVVSRYADVNEESELPYDCEEAALLWINKSCLRLRHRIEEQLTNFHSNDNPDSSPIHGIYPPVISLAQDLGDLSDGCCLAALFCLYCPKYFCWQDIRMNDPMSLADSVHNLQLVQKFCQDRLPQDIYCLTLEDMVYLHPSILPNVLTLVADLMYIFEIRPPKHITRPGIRNDTRLAEDFSYINLNGERQSSPLPIYPQRQSDSPSLAEYDLPEDTQTMSPHSNGSWSKMQKSPSHSSRKLTEDRKNEDKSQDSEDFTEPLTSQSYPAEDDDELAGYFSPTPGHCLLNQEDNRRSKQAHPGNDNIAQTHFKVFHANNPMKGIKSSQVPHVENKASLKKSPSSYEIHQLSPSKQNIPKSQGYPRQRSQSELDIPFGKKQVPVNHVNRHVSENILHENDEMQNTLSKVNMREPSSMTSRRNRNSFHEVPRHGSQGDRYAKPAVPRRNNSDFFLHEGRDIETRSSRLSGSQTWRKPKDLFARTEFQEEQDSLENNNRKCGDSEPETLSFAKLSKQRNDSGSAINVNYMHHDREIQSGTYKKPAVRPGYLHISPSQKNIPENSPTSAGSKGNNWFEEDHSNISPTDVDASVATQMLDIRLQLEEKRKKIEQEKTRLEAMTKRQREKMGKAAFLQAVRNSNAYEQNMRTGNKNFSVEDLTEDLDSVRRKWLEKRSSDMEQEACIEDIENESPSDDFQSSIEQLNCNLTDLQSDISRLTQQQETIQTILKNSNQPQQQQGESYFLHDSNAVQQRERWAEPVPYPFQQPQQQQQQQTQPMQEMPPHGGRGHWGQPVMPFSNMQPNHPVHTTPSWQQPSPMYPGRPASVEPQMMTGQPINMLPPMYEQSPGLPYPGTMHQGFSLHPQQHTHQASYGMQPHPNEQQRNFYPGQYNMGHGPFNMFQQQQQQQPNYGMMQNAYPTSVPNSQNQMQYQSPGFHLHKSPSANFISNHDFVNSPSQANQLFNQSEAMPIPKSQSKADIPYHIQENPQNNVDDFCRPKVMQNSPPNKPVLGKTFRVAKPKITSPLSPNPSLKSPFAQDVKQEQMMEPETQQSETTSSAPSDKGFYISFEEAEQPRKPKPKLKPKHLKARSQQRKLEESRRSESESVDGPLTDNHNYSTEQSSVPNESQQQYISDDIAQEPAFVSAKANATGSTYTKVCAPPVKAPGVGFVVGSAVVETDPDKEMEMTRRKEMIMMMSMRRRAEQEAKRNEKQQEYNQKKEEERFKIEQAERKKEDEKLRRQLILEQYRQRKAADEEDGSTGGGGGNRENHRMPNKGATINRSKSRSASVTRHAKAKSTQRAQDLSSPSSLDSPVGRGSQYNLSGGYPDDLSSEHSYTPSPRRSHNYPHSSPISPSSYPSSPGPLLPGMLSVSNRSRGTPSDGLSDTSSTISSAWASEYCGPKLFVKPSTKSNRGIITNAVNTVLAGAVNSETKRKVLEEIEQSEGKHFLILFRDAGCQFRALYSYNPETEEVIKLYGTGPKVVTNKMMDRFYKYNSGGKSFTQIHTKHLTATIDAFTIQNSLWQSKKVTSFKREYV